MLELSNTQSAQCKNTISTKETVISTDNVTVNRQTITAEVHRDASGASCSAGETNGSNSVRHENSQ